MKKKLWLTVLTFIAVFALVIGITACNNKQPETQQPEAQQLETPVVSISDEGLASWTAIENASGYAYKLDNGEETNTEATSVQLTDGQSISVKALGKDGYKDSSWSDVKTYTHQASSQKLNTPVVSISNSGLASWAPVTGATGYKYKINNGETKTATGTSVQLENGQSIKVMAVGNGTTYTDSEWSAEKTYTVSTATKLDTPDVSINNEGVASWAANDNAEGFIVKINGVDGQLTSDTSATLTDGQRIQVKAVGDGTNYTDSDWSEEKTYTAIEDSAVTSVVFDFKGVITEYSFSEYNATTIKPVLESALSETVGFEVSATSKVYPGDQTQNVVGALKFSNSNTMGSLTLVFNKNVKRVVLNAKAYNTYAGSIAINDGTAQSVTNAAAVDLTFNLTPSKTVKIDAKENRFYVYTITVYFEDYEAKLATPTLAVDLDGVVTWDEVANATKYAYQIGDGNVQYVELTEDRSIQLTDGQTVKVWAVGNADYADSAAAEISYTMVPVTLDVPVVEVNHAGVASWHAVEGAVKYVYVINDGEEQETTHHSVQLTNGQSIKVKAVGKEGSRFQASAYCEPVTYTAPTVAEQLENPTVTVAIDGTVRIENADAVSFDYTIGDGEKQNVANGADGAAVTLETKLTNGQTIKVVAKGDGTYYTDSAEVEITYTAPQALEAVTEVTIAVEGTTAKKVVITWTAVANATGYSYQIGSAAAVTTTATTLTDTLNEGTVFSVTALGNTATAETAADGNYSAYYLDSTVYVAPAFNIDNEKIYTVAEMVKIAKYYGTTAPSKEFTVTGVVTSNVAYSSQYSNIDVVIKEGDQTFTIFRANFSAELLDAWKTTEANELVGYTVTATGKPFYYNSTTLEFNSGCKITAIEMAAADRVAKAKAALDGALDFTVGDSDYTYKLLLTGTHGTTITWAFEGLEEDDYDYEDGMLVVTRKATDVNFTATATISYTNGDDRASDTLSFELIVEATGKVVAQEKVIYELPASVPTGGNNGYDGNGDVTVDGIVWNIQGNNQMSPWRFGGKSLNATDRALTGKTAISGKVTKVLLTATDDGSITVNSITLKVYTAEPKTDSTPLSTKTASYTKDTELTFTAGANEDWTDCFYQIVFNVTVSVASNKYVTISKLEFWGYDVPLTEEEITTALDKISLESSYEATGFNLRTKIDKVEISWTSSNTEYVEIADGKATINCEEEQTVTLTATADCGCGTDTHHTRTFSVKVKKPSAGGPLTSPATLSFATKDNRVSQDSNSQVWKSNGITFTNNKADSSTAVADYANPVRCYANSDIIVECEGAFTTATFDCASGKVLANTNTVTADGATATISVSNTTVTITFSAPVTSFTITKLSAQVQIKTLTLSA